MNLIIYSISGFLIVKFFFAKSKIEAALLGTLCLLVSAVIKYESNPYFDLSMAYHTTGALLILILLNYLSKKIRHR